jgi:hypothetical protein
VRDQVVCRPTSVEMFSVTFTCGSSCPCSYHTRVYPEVSELAAWSENCKWYSSLPLGVSQPSEFCCHNTLCCFSTTLYCCCLFRYRLSLETFGYTLVITRTFSV